MLIWKANNIQNLETMGWILTWKIVEKNAASC